MGHLKDVTANSERHRPGIFRWHGTLPPLHQRLRNNPATTTRVGIRNSRADSPARSRAYALDGASRDSTDSSRNSSLHAMPGDRPPESLVQVDLGRPSRRLPKPAVIRLEVHHLVGPE